MIYMNEKLQLKEYLQKLETISEIIDVQDEYREPIIQIDDMIDSEVFKIAVVGEFSAGKSTFINALLGDELLYSTNKEATGVVTSICTASEAKAFIYSESDDLIESFSLQDKTGKNKLKSYLDINSHSKTGCVKIDYPIEGLEENVILLDTPGIEKMSPAQLKMTSKAIHMANAVLFLISKEGFTESGLDVITGHNKVIGQIPTNNVFVVMTHIGELYDEYDDAEIAEKKIEILGEKVKKELSDHGLEKLRFFQVDSMYYLLGINQEIYNKEKALRETTNFRLKNDMPDKIEFIDRSRFRSFQRELMEFLNGGNNKELLLADIKSKIFLVAEALYEKARELNTKKIDEIDKLVTIKEHQMERIVKGQRKVYNNVVRVLRNDLNQFIDSIETDCDNKAKERDRNLYMLINELFKSVSDIKMDNLELCLNAVRTDMKSFSKELEYQTNCHMQYIENDFLAKLFKDKFKEVFDDEEVKISISVSFNKYQVQFSESKKEFTLDDKELKEMEKERDETENEQNNYSKALNDLERVLQLKEKTISTNKTKLETWINEKMRELGSRPPKEQKYRYVHKTKGHLWWKKEWDDPVPDGMDDSKGRKWDEDQKRLFDRYEQEYNKISSEESEVCRLKQEKYSYERKIESLERNKRRLTEKIKLQRDYLKEEEEKFAESYLNNKKMEVLSCCNMVKHEMLDQTVEQIRNYLYAVRERLEKEADSVIKSSIDEYEKKLKSDNEKLCQSQTVSKKIFDGYMNDLQILMEATNNECD